MWRNKRLLVLILVLVCVSIYALAGVNFSSLEDKYNNWQRERQAQIVHDIYKKLIAASGQTQNVLPLEIVDSAEINAYNDGSKVVIYTGLIASTKSWDEVALVLGHEIAHGMLQHLGKLNSQIPNEITVLEGNADKYGAFLMMKTGYSICKARELFLRWTWETGNGLTQSHPPNIYRYNEINIGCGQV